MDQMFLTTDIIIIIYVLNPLIVVNKFLLNSLDDILFVYNPRLFYNSLKLLNIVMDQLLLIIKVKLTPIFKP